MPIDAFLHQKQVAGPFLPVDLNWHRKCITLAVMMRIVRKKSRIAFPATILVLVFLCSGLVWTAGSLEASSDDVGRVEAIQPVSTMLAEIPGYSFFEQLIVLVRQVHPLILAGAQFLIVVGVCLILTDNHELELYLKIDFRPPKPDILK